MVCGEGKVALHEPCTGFPGLKTLEGKIAACFAFLRSYEPFQEEAVL
jgi:hypothetical protein